MKRELDSPRRTREILECLALELETTVAELLATIERGRRYFLYGAGGRTSGLLAAGELGKALDRAHEAGVDVRTLEIMDLAGAPATLRRAAAAAFN